MPEVLYGRNPVLEALRAGRRLRRLLLAPALHSEPRLDEIGTRAAEVGVEPEVVSRRRLADIAHTEHHQGVAGYFDARQLPGLAFLRQALVEPAAVPPLLVCLDGIQDPQNLGAIARSAEAMGVRALVISKNRTVAPTAAAVKASAGALEHLTVVSVSNLVAAMAEIAKAGVLLVGLEPDGEQRVDQADLRGPVALVVGAEGTGLRPLVRRSCDLTVRIPMGGRVASLNASAALALVLYETRRQQRFVGLADPEVRPYTSAAAPT